MSTALQGGTVALVAMLIASACASSPSPQAEAAAVPQVPQAPRDAPSPDATARSHTYPVLYCGGDGETHWKDETANLTPGKFAPPAKPVSTGGIMTVSRSLFGAFEPNWGSTDTIPHPTPARQFVVLLQGTAEVTTTDGDTRSFSAGDIIHVTDTAPCKGHITVFGEEGGKVFFVQQP